MNLFNYYWAFESALTPRFCDEVIKYALGKKDTIAEKEIQISYGLMILGFIKNSIPLFIKPIKMRAGILSGIDRNLVNLPSIN